MDQTTIDSLMAVEKKPLVQLQTKLTSLEDEKNAWNDIKTRMNTLLEKVKELKSPDTFNARTAVSSDESALSFNASENAPIGEYKVEISRLASSTNVISGTVAAAAGSSSSQMGITGSFTIANHENDTFQIDVTATDSLNVIRDKINANTEVSGIKASIIDSRLVISDTVGGDRNIVITDGGTGVVSELGLDALASTKVQGQTALFSINGVSVERNSNTVSDVIENVTISLKKEHKAGAFDTVTVSQDRERAAEALQEFVDQYNSTMSFMEEAMEYGDPEKPDSAGALAGDGTLMRLHATLRSMVNSFVENDLCTIKDISSLGVKTMDRYGELTFDKAEFNKALDADPEMVADFFYSKNSLGEDAGFTVKLNAYLDNFVSYAGIIKGKTDSYERTIEDINKQVDAFNIRMEKREEYYINMFTKLDVALMEAENQMNWLTSQIAGLSTSTE